MQVKLYTDGAARGNPDGPGGYGAVLEYVDTKGVLHTKELSQGYVRTTNNRMELSAVIAGLEALNRPCVVEIYSDSKYVVDAFNQHWIDGWLKKGWKRGKNEPVKNVDLWKRLLAAKEKHQVTFHWVKDMPVIRRTSGVMNWQRQRQTEMHGSWTRDLKKRLDKQQESAYNIFVR